MFKKYNKNVIYIIAEIGVNFITLKEAKLVLEIRTFLAPATVNG
jgi:hypothetical protein